MLEKSKRDDMRKHLDANPGDYKEGVREGYLALLDAADEWQKIAEGKDEIIEKWKENWNGAAEKLAHVRTLLVNALYELEVPGETYKAIEAWLKENPKPPIAEPEAPKETVEA